jgi:hypothetical protein
MYKFNTQLATLEVKNPTPHSANQEQAFRDILSYLDSLTEHKAFGDKLVQGEIEAVNHFLRGQ